METRVPSDRAKTLMTSLSFVHSFVVEAVGFSGGIWLFWDNSFTGLEVLAWNDQCVTVAVNRGVFVDWVVLAIYTSPNSLVRSDLLTYLSKLGTVLRVPWLLAGDFNQIVDPAEKSGGKPVPWSRLASLWNCFTACNLLDLGFSGPKFTWTNNRRGQGKIRERLDRAVCNPACRLKFPYHFVKYLPRTHSDHHPLLISCAQRSPSVPSGISPFRIQELWFCHPTFEPLILKIWSAGHGRLSSCFRILPLVVWDWNRHVFGTLFYRTACCRARLEGIQWSLSHRE